VAGRWVSARRYEPAMGPNERHQRLAAWRAAVARARTVAPAV
jgi:hypothetical protein